MARTPEEDLPVSRAYRRLLKSEIKLLGRDRIADLADINPATVHRNINEGNLTYTTAMKLRDAIAQAHAEDKQPGRPIPPPFVAVVSQSHYDMCELLGRLHELDYEAFAEIMEETLEKVRDATLAQANRAVAHPIRNPDDDSDDDQ